MYAAHTTVPPEKSDSGVETFEQAFFYHLALPQGGTVGEHVESRYRAALAEPSRPLLGGGA